MHPTINSFSKDIMFPHYVECISERESKPGQITVGENYIMDLSTVHIDRDGDAYADFYTVDHIHVGRLHLKHFMSYEGSVYHWQA